MHRRMFLRGLGAGLALALVPVPGLSRSGAAIPVLMFHKVVDTPAFPEDIGSGQLAALFDALWKQGFCPVNMTDILDGKVDGMVPRGMKPVGITADDAHRSIVFSQATAQHEQQRNARSFVDIFAESLSGSGRMPRATFFIAAVGDDRYTKKVEGYFGNYEPLPRVMDRLGRWPGLEIGYHTRSHRRMTGMGAEQVRSLMQEQMDDFAAQGILERVVPVLAYPYGELPKPEGVEELRRMGFKGAVLAFPGVREGRYESIPACGYGGGLLCDPFHIPRVCIGSFAYASQKTAQGRAYTPIDPLADFQKDVLESLPGLYVSKGAGA